MPLNDPTAPPEVRRPRPRVLVNGTELPGVLSVEVEDTNDYHASRFTVEVALNAPGSHGLDWWGNQNPPVMVDVQVGFLDPGADEGTAVTHSLIVGEIDRIEPQPLTGTLHIEGRDLTARFIETKTQASYKNQTASEIAQTLAQNHQMQAVVTPTTTLVSRYYQEDHDHLTLDQFSRTTTEWDLLVYLAQHEQYDVFVQGQTLYFQPATQPNADPWVVRYQAADALSPVPRCNVTDLRTPRALTLAKDIEVWVRSWHSGKAQSFVRKARAVGAKSASIQQSANQKGTNTQRYVYVIPNLTEEQAQQRANALLAEITRHERLLSFRAPADLVLTPRSMVRLEGTNSSWDQAYYVDRVTRQLSWDEGFQMDVACKNHSPLSMTEPT